MADFKEYENLTLFFLAPGAVAALLAPPESSASVGETTKERHTITRLGHPAPGQCGHLCPYDPINPFLVDGFVTTAL